MTEDKKADSRSKRGGPSVLVVGVGNPTRRDDGIGVELIRRLESETIKGVDCDANFQLNVEDALTWSRYDVVVFIDAAREGPEPFSFAELRPSFGITLSTHKMSPEAVLALCHELYDRRPVVHVLAVRGYEWAVAEGLSPEAESNLAAALEFLKDFLGKHRKRQNFQEGGGMKKPKTKELLVLEDILGSNKKVAAGIRKKLMEKGILGVNLMSSPGSGKTALLEALAGRMKGRFNLGVIEGDIETERDAERIRAKGIPAWQITTGGACHLEAKMVANVFPLVPADLDFLFIENVGNLVCPASYDLGESIRMVLLSAPEGDDKPKKYPEAFLAADALVMTKTDLLPYLPFSPERAGKEALEMNPRLKVFLTSALSGQGLEAVVDYLADELRNLRSAHA